MLRKTYISNLLFWKSFKSRQLLTNLENLRNASKYVKSNKMEPNLINPIHICQLIQMYSNAIKSLKHIQLQTN